MRNLFLLYIGLIFSTSLFAQSKSLFNGKDLTGWHVDIPAADTNANLRKSFIVRNGQLVSMGTPEGHLITDAIYQNYRLDIEYRFTAKPGNCGVLVHASTPRILYAMFPKSIEVQMMHNQAGDFWVIGEDIEVKEMEKYRGSKEKWGVTEGLNRQIKATMLNEKPLGKWNKMRVECFENQIKVWVNGKMVNLGYNCTVSQGQIALQAEGSEVAFRKLILTPITSLSK
jgi:hypothetical protein